MLNEEQMRTVKGIKLHRVSGEDLISCVPVYFESGGLGVDTVLRRSLIAEEVKIDGELGDYFADLLDKEGDIVCSVPLDQDSYRMLKTRWARTVLQASK